MRARRGVPPCPRAGMWVLPLIGGTPPISCIKATAIAVAFLVSVGMSCQDGAEVFPLVSQPQGVGEVTIRIPFLTELLYPRADDFHKAPYLTPRGSVSHARMYYIP